MLYIIYKAHNTKILQKLLNEYIMNGRIVCIEKNQWKILKKYLIKVETIT